MNAPSEASGTPPPKEPIAPWRQQILERIDRNGRYPRWVLLAALAGMFATTFPITILAVALGPIATEFGEKRYAVDAYAAEPGTLASREEFRGTGGSLYFLRRQDLLAGSERVRIELRDKASGLVTGVVNLTPAMDYDIDYLQGRIVLSEPLASTADDNLLVRSGAVSGDEAYLVVRYEYSPGFESIDAVSVGGQAHYWFGDYVKLGATANSNEQDGEDSSLSAVDLTARYSADTWFKYQQGTSEGLVSLPQVSVDGGFEFAGYDSASFVNAKADASRTDVSFRVGDFT